MKVVNNNKKNVKNVKVVQEIKPDENEESKNFDTNCKYEFPVFVAPKPQEQPPIANTKAKVENPKSSVVSKPEKKPNKPQTTQKQKKIDSTNAWEKQNANPFVYYTTDNKVSKKALNEEFPSLGGNNVENKGIHSFAQSCLYFSRRRGWWRESLAR